MQSPEEVDHLKASTQEHRSGPKQQHLPSTMMMRRGKKPTPLYAATLCSHGNFKWAAPFVTKCHATGRIQAKGDCSPTIHTLPQYTLDARIQRHPRPPQLPLQATATPRRKKRTPQTANLNRPHNQQTRTSREEETTHLATISKRKDFKFYSEYYRALVQGSPYRRNMISWYLFLLGNV